jgi:hypothetical protein
MLDERGYRSGRGLGEAVAEDGGVQLLRVGDVDVVTQGCRKGGVVDELLRRAVPAEREAVRGLVAERAEHQLAHPETVAGTGDALDCQFEEQVVERVVDGVPPGVVGFDVLERFGVLRVGQVVGRAVGELPPAILPKVRRRGSVGSPMLYR